MFVDASAIVAILLNEDGSAELEARMSEHSGAFYFSQIARYEAVMGLARAKSPPTRGGVALPATQIEAARGAVDEFLGALGAREVAIQGDVGVKALAAAIAYGKGTGHPASLNMGDCFAYGCAKAYRIPLLYKGDDFSRTDIG